MSEIASEKLIWVRGWNGIPIQVDAAEYERRRELHCLQEQLDRVKATTSAIIEARCMPSKEELERRASALAKAIREESVRLDWFDPHRGEWRPCPQNERFEVSDRGFLRNQGSKRLLTPQVSDSGYVNFVGIAAHRAVALAFIPNPYNLPHVNHIDLDRSHNQVSNLEWASVVTNQGHTKRLAVEAFARSAAIVREHALDYPDNPRVQEALAQCEARIRALGVSIEQTVEGDHFALAYQRLQRGCA